MLELISVSLNERLARKEKKYPDHDFADLRSFSVYEPQILDEFGFSESDYEDYAAMYKNVMEELKRPDNNPNPSLA